MEIKLYNLFFNKVAFYNMVFITLSVIALVKYPFLFAALLLDVFKRSPDLQNLIKTISTNRVQLLYTSCLIVIATYIFSMWGYVFIPEFYVNEEEESEFDAELLTYCDTLWN